MNLWRHGFKPDSTAHLLGCSCSVCWAHNYCDALVLFPCPALDSAPSPYPTDYFTYYDYTADFKRKNHTSDAVERASSRGTRLLGRDLSAP